MGIQQAAAIAEAAEQLLAPLGYGEAQAVELPLHGLIQGLPVVGTIDRVVQLEPGGPRRVIDLKSGADEPLRHAAQLGAYCSLLPSDLDPVLLMVPRFRRGTDAGEVLARSRHYPLNAREVRQIARRAAATWSAILEGEGERGRTRCRTSAARRRAASTGRRCARLSDWRKRNDCSPPRGDRPMGEIFTAALEQVPPPTRG